MKQTMIMVNKFDKHMQEKTEGVFCHRRTKKMHLLPRSRDKIASDDIGLALVLTRKAVSNLK